MRKNFIFFFYFAILFTIILILYGSLLRHHYKGGKKFITLQKIAVFFAEVPHVTKKIKTGITKVDAPPKLLRHQNKETFKFKNKKSC